MIETYFIHESTQVVINRGISSDPISDFDFISKNQLNKFDGALNLVAFSVGATLIRGTIKIDWLTKAEKDQLCDFFAQTLQFIKPFRVIILNGNDAVDFGGFSKDGIQSCFVDESITSTDQILMPTGKGNRYNLVLPYVSFEKSYLQYGTL